MAGQMNTLGVPVEILHQPESKIAKLTRIFNCVLYFFLKTWQGDSGGPLVCEMDGDWVQAGIASFLPMGVPGVAASFPSVFTRVTSYVDWIYETIEYND